MWFRARGRLAVALAAGTMTWASGARAGDVDDLAGMLDESVVSTASKTAESAHDAPATTTVITSDDLRRYGIHSLDEAIDYLAMGMTTSSSLAAVDVGGRGVMLTADYGDHLLILLDGHILNEGWSSASYVNVGLGVPLEMIDHVELLLGPGSVLYGNSAMLGVINIVTKKASDFSGVRVIAEGSLSPAQSARGFTSFAPKELGNTYRLSAGAGEELTLFGARVGVTAQVERYQLDGPSLDFANETFTNPDGSPKNFGPKTALGVWGGRVRDGYAMTVTDAYVRAVIGDLTLSVRSAAYERKTPYLNDFTQLFGNFDDGRNGELDRWLSFDARYSKQITPKLGLEVRGTLDSYDYQQQLYSDDVNDCVAASTGPCRFTLTGISRWIGTDAHLAYDWNLDDRVTTMIGASVQGRFVGSKTDYLDTQTHRELGTVGERSAYEVPFAAYAQQRWTPTRWAHFNAGLRFDDAPRGGAHLSPRAAAAFDVWKGATAKAIYSEGFRAPTFYEAYYQAPNWNQAPNLKAETERSVEASFEQRVGRHKLLIGAFRTWWTNMVEVQALPDGNAQYANISSIENYGYNARAEGSFGRVRYGVSATGAYTRRMSPDGTTPLPVAPSVIGNGHISCELPGELPTIGLASNVVGSRLADRALDGGFTPMPSAPGQLRARLTVSGAVSAVPGLTYRAGIDVATATRSAYVAGPVQQATPDVPSAQLAPVNRLTIFSGLQYEFGR